jgi:hypothetical protein
MARCTQYNFITIKFVNDLLQVIGFLWVPFSSTNKTGNWNIVESVAKHHKFITLTLYTITVRLR